jgi:butyrate kinase
VVNKPVTQRRAGFSAPTPIGSPIGSPISISLNVPVYVVGPQTLAQRLVGVGVP